MPDAVKVGGGYRESKDFVPNPADQTRQYNTSGLGAHQQIEEVAPIFEVDKVRTAEQISRALDPSDSTVSRDRVVLPDGDRDPDKAEEDLKKVAKARVKRGVTVGGPGPAESRAALPNENEPRAEGGANANPVTEQEKKDTKGSEGSGSKGSEGSGSKGSEGSGSKTS